MMETDMSEAPKAGTKATSGKTDIKTNGVENFPLHFAQMQARNIASMTRASEILAQSAKAVWDNEVEMFKLESENARQSFTPNGAAPGASFSGLMGQIQRNTEATIGRMRAINDIVRDCEWQLLSLAADNIAASQPRTAE